MNFDPCNHLLKIWESIAATTPKVRAHLKVWGFIPSHFLTLFLTLPGTWNVTPELHSWLVHQTIVGQRFFWGHDLKNAHKVVKCVLGWVPQEEILHDSTTSDFWAHYVCNFALESTCARIFFLEWPMIAKQGFNCKSLNLPKLVYMVLWSLDKNAIILHVNVFTLHLHFNIFKWYQMVICNC